MIRKSHRTVLATSLAAALLAGCGDNQVRRQLGLLHQGPDPFTSIANQPIVMPDTDTLPVPDASAVSPIEPDPLRAAREALAIAEPAGGPASRTEALLLATLDAEDADPAIRTLVDSEYEPDDDGTLFGATPLVHRVFGIRERVLRRENAIDPAAELERLRQSGIVTSPGEADPEDIDS